MKRQSCGYTNSRGASLGGTLLAVAFLSVLAFSLSSLSVSHLRMSSRQERGMEASNAARSAVSAAIAKVLEEPTFGRTRVASHTVRLDFANATSLLTFDLAAARDEKIPYSTNNLEAGTDDVPGDEGAIVPANTAHLIAVGRSGGVERRIDAVLRVPAFPWAIASGGRIDTRNGVYVAALPEGVWPPPTDESEYLPADLAANGLGSKAIDLGDNSTILGDVEAVGQVHMQSPSKVVVKGEVRSGSSPIELPVMNLDDYDPERSGIDHFPLTDGSLSELTGVARAGQSVKFDAPLKLDNGQLFVDGDLTLNGGVSGNGIIMATGNITVNGGAQVEAPTELAVLAGKNVKLRGEGVSRSRIRGLFYSGGSMEASELTLVGSLLTGKASTGMLLDEVNVLFEEPSVTAKAATPVAGDTVYAGRFNAGTRSVVLDPRDLSWSTPGYQYAFSVKMEPRGTYPSKMTVSLGVPPGGTRTWTITKDTDLKGPRDWVKSALSSAGTVTTPGRDNFNQAFGDVTVTAIEGVPDSSPSGAPPQITSGTLFSDISKFIPFADRIRLVSWIER